jgi:hypothetical protein
VKKYIQYVALGTMMVLGSGFMTEANAFGFKSLVNKAKNAVDACNASACGSPKGLTLTTQCLPDAETATKNKNCAAAFWAGHCQGADATTNAEACGISSTAASLPEGFVCDEAAATTPDETIKKSCFNPLGLKKNKLFAWTFWHHENNCKAQGKKKPNSKYSSQCKAIKGVYAKIDTDQKPAAPTPPAAPAEEPAAEEPAE